MPQVAEAATCNEVERGASVAASSEVSASGVSLSKTAFEHTRRCGGPASVVDPLLALVVSLRRLEELVLSVLDSLGVQSDQLGFHRRDLEGAEGTGLVAPDDSALEELPPIDRYIVAHEAQRRSGVRVCGTSRDVSHETRKTCIEAICRWVDEVSSFDTGSHVAKSREELVSQVARAASADSGDIASTSVLGCKRQRSTCVSEERDAFMRSHWQHYATQLRAGHRAERAVLKAVCATDIGKGLCSQAKCVPAETDSLAKGIVMPAAAALRGNHEILMLSKDALADCQRGVTELLSSLEDRIDEYVEQSRNVAEREEIFWRNVRVVEWESKALLELSRYVERCC